MKKLLTIALCALFAIHAAEARTLYVDATRPNNKGNGLKAKTAKKTIQAAINIAKNGDTIIVYPGKYHAPIKTNNKKITIKSKSGKAKTEILKKKGPSPYGRILVDAGSGTKSKLTGFSFTDGWLVSGSKGGTFSNCDFSDVGRGSLGYPDNSLPTFYKSSFANCVFSKCYADTFGDVGMFGQSTLKRCAVQDSSEYRGATIFSSALYNCLLNGNEQISLSKNTLVNCTVAENNRVKLSKNKAYNTLFYKVAASQFKKSKKNTLKNCYKGADPKFVSTKTTVEKWVADPYGWEKRIIGAEVEWDDNDSDYGTVTVSGTTDTAILAAAKAKVGKTNVTYAILEYEYEYGDYETVELPGDYRLAKGSPCINKGKLTKSLKKLVGSKDLAGRKRILGKAVDIGCYEY